MTSIGCLGRLGRASATVAPVFAFLFLAIPEALAQDQNTIRACVQKGSQQVRVIGAAEQCRQTETLITWSVQGPPGGGAPVGRITGQLRSCNPNENVSSRLATILGQSFVAFSDHEGRFALSSVPVGNWKVSFPDQVLPVSQDATVAINQTTDLGLLLVTDVRADPKNCGDCGIACARPNQTGACANGACNYGACYPGFGDCNGDPSDGCEMSLVSDPAHCGSCNTPCSLPNAAASCVSGICLVAACTPGFGDCDSLRWNGCETDFLSDPLNCGACGHVCGGACTDGVCEPSACTPVEEVCNGLDDDCNDVVDDVWVGVGECRRQCSGCSNGGPNCVAGQPSTEVCDGKDNDCDGLADNGAWCANGTCIDGTCRPAGICVTDGDCGVPVCVDRGTDCIRTSPRCTSGACSTYSNLFPNSRCNQSAGTCESTQPPVCQPSPETCDGVDNDCDGRIDNIGGTGSPIARACYSGPPGTAGVGVCKTGVQSCTGGMWPPGCVGEVLPSAEVCDGVDNDCDGGVDYGAWCGDGRTCVSGVCVDK